MTELHLPFIEITILIPLVGAALVSRCGDMYRARHWAVVFAGAALASAVATWIDFEFLRVAEADDRWHFLGQLLGRTPLVIDRLNAPLLPLAALLYFLTTVTTLRTKIRRFSFVGTLISEAILLATLSCREPWVLVALLIAGTAPPYFELRARRRPTRVFALYMGLFAGLLVVGQTLVSIDGPGRLHTWWALLPLFLAVLVRSGMVPLHGWVNDLFENATFGTALLFCLPQVGAYAAVRLVLPIAETSVLRSLGAVSLITAVYAAGLALVQRDARSFFGYLFLSASSLVLVGLEVVTPVGLTGALCVWLSVGLSLGAFGLTLRALEARRGDLSLTEFQGLYEHTPALAVSFFLAGLASVGFPGTFGFIGTELLIDGAVTIYPYIGVALVVASALNGIAFVKVYFLLFTGKRHTSTVSLAIGLRERLAVLTVATIIVVGGLVPRYTVSSRHAAAEELLRQRPATLDDRSVAERAADAGLTH